MGTCLREHIVIVTGASRGIGKTLARACAREAVERMQRQTGETYGSPTVLVNNASRLNAIGPTWELDPDNAWQDQQVNLYGTFLCSRAVVPGMLVRNHGWIIKRNGGGDSRAFPYGSAYIAAMAPVARTRLSRDREDDHDSTG